MAKRGGRKCETDMPRRRSGGPGLGPWDCPQPPGRDAGRIAPVVVHAPCDGGRRQVSVAGEAAGVAYGAADVLALVRRFGVELEYGEVAASALIEWRGGGPDAWS